MQELELTAGLVQIPSASNAAAGRGGCSEAHPAGALLLLVCDLEEQNLAV